MTNPNPVTSGRWPAAPSPQALYGAAVWSGAVLLSLYLGLAGGGYDIVVRSELGLIIWWVVLLGVLIGLLPRHGVSKAGWIAAALLAGFLVWSWTGLSWTGSHELTLVEVGRISTYLGVFVLVLAAIDLRRARGLINGLTCGIATVSGLAVLSKLAPGLFPADTARSFYATARLSYPFDYADGVGEYAALGIPLVLMVMTSGRTRAGRALAAAALQLLLLCLALTVSRGGILAAVVGIVVFYALIPDRVPRLPALATSAMGIAVLMLALLQRAALRDSIAAAPGGERHSMLAILVVVMLAVAALQIGTELTAGRFPRPGWTVFSRRRAQLLAAGVLVLVAALILALFASGTAAEMWRSFKVWSPTLHTNQYFRLFSLAGSHRYQYWQVAWKAFTGNLLHGIGPGTFRFYWEGHTTYSEYVLNAHSLWFETLAETGLVGWALLAGCLGYVVIGGASRALRRGLTSDRRIVIATATAAVAAFCAAASFDWVWQIGVVPMVALALAALTFVAEPAAPQNAGPERVELPAASGPRAYAALALRVPKAAASLVAIALIAVPLASTVALRRSQAQARQGDFTAALKSDATALALEPSSSSAYLQRALLLEQADQLAAAAQAISAAIAREPDNYYLWLEASRIATERNHARAATADYAHAERLYPTSPLFTG